MKFAEVEIAVTVNVEFCFCKVSTNKDIMKTFDDIIKAKNKARRKYSKITEKSCSHVIKHKYRATSLIGEDGEKAI